MAQLVEQRIRNAQVAGSSPAASSTKPRHFRRNDGVLLLSYKFTQYEIIRCVLSVSYFKKSGHQTTIGMPCTAITQSLFWVYEKPKKPKKADTNTKTNTDTDTEKDCKGKPLKYFLFYAVVSVVALSEICKTSENFSVICAAFSSADAITCAYMFAVVLT